MVYSVREVPLSHPVRSANIRIFGTFVLRQIRLKEQCVLQGVFLVWPPPNLTKSQALYKLLDQGNLWGASSNLYRTWDLVKGVAESEAHCINADANHT